MWANSGWLAGRSLQHTPEWKSHGSAEQVAEGQGGRGHKKRVKRESLSDQCTEKSPLLLQKVAQRYMQVLHYTVLSAMCVNSDNSIWLKGAGKPLKNTLKKQSSHFKIYPMLTIAWPQGQGREFFPSTVLLRELTWSAEPSSGTCNIRRTRMYSTKTWGGTWRWSEKWSTSPVWIG